MSAADAAAGQAPTMPIRLRTSLPGCSIPYVPYMVPVTWRRSQLSTLVNKVLATAQGDDQHKPIPFDFIVDGTLLRTSLDEFLAQREQTAETTLELEYIRSTLPPAFRDAATQDDWVSAVDARRAGCVLSTSYDGNVRVYDVSAMDAEPATYMPAYAPRGTSLSCGRWLTDNVVATGSMSGIVTVWRTPGTEHQKLPVLHAAELRHHTAPVSSLDVCVRGERGALLSAGWDGSLALWDVPADARFGAVPSDGGASKKRRTTTTAAAGAASADAPSLEPTLVLHHVTPTVGASAAKALGTVPTPGANARTFAAFDAHMGDTRAWSAAWDGSVKCWDVQAGGVPTGQKNSDKVPLCLDPVRGTRGVAGAELVTGHMDHSLALYDFRDTVTNTAVAIAQAHAAPVSAVRTHPTSAHLFASGAYDGRLKVWDMRSPKQALFSLAPPAKPGKILGLDWTPDGDSLAAGGEDCRVSIYQGSAMGVEHV